METEEVPRMYAAVIVYESSSPAVGFEPVFEEAITLLRANSEEHATSRALTFGRSRETQYENEFGETITWSLKHVVDVAEVVDQLDDGAEVYTRHFQNYEAYRAFEMLS